MHNRIAGFFFIKPFKQYYASPIIRIMKNFKIFTGMLLMSLALVSCASTRQADSSESFPPPSSSPDAVEFEQVWGYVMYGREDKWDNNLPVSDIGYFTQAITTFSKVPEIPPKDKYFSNCAAKVHLVTSCDSRAQTHLLLSPDLPLRDTIIDGLVKASQTYDGLQIDWELVSAEDKDNYIEFLRILKSRIGEKPLTVAIPARLKTLSKDAYAYKDMAQTADQIIIMAYDQHWATSGPGAIAETDWCRNIAEYAKSQIPPEKLVMGMSFYGRAWRDDTIGGKAYTYPSLQEIMAENRTRNHKRDEYEIPSFEIKKNLEITFFYDDAASLLERTRMYADCGIKAISFWRIGQEDKNYWQYLKITEDVN